MEYFNPFNGLPVIRQGEAIFVPLPSDQWGGSGRCDCPHCNGKIGYWDTLAVNAKPDKTKGRSESTWTVHHPTLQRKGVYAARWELDALAAKLAQEWTKELKAGDK